MSALLLDDDQFDEAIANMVKIIVYHDGVPYNPEGGVIQSHDLFMVTIDGDHYFKATCEFVVAPMILH